MHKLAVIGNPVAHSRSPQIHQAFADQAGLEVLYERVFSPLGEFERTVGELLEQGYTGMNVTVPFKEQAHDLCQSRSVKAEQAGAVNTLSWTENGLGGDNTDGTGLVVDLAENLGWVLRDSRILVLGAGGAVRGVLPALLEQKPALIQVSNRTMAKADLLYQRFSHLGPLELFDPARMNEPFDLIINGTSAGLSGELPVLPGNCVGSGTRCYDMLYGIKPTGFMQHCLGEGAAEAADGLGMLVEQAAAAFHLWLGFAPATTVVIRELRSALKASLKSEPGT